jgi:hypothetical protein
MAPALEPGKDQISTPKPPKTKKNLLFPKRKLEVWENYKG